MDQWDWSCLNWPSQIWRIKINYLICHFWISRHKRSKILANICLSCLQFLRLLHLFLHHRFWLFRLTVQIAYTWYHVSTSLYICCRMNEVVMIVGVSLGILATTGTTIDVIDSTWFQNLNEESMDLIVKIGNLPLDLLWALKLLKKALDFRWI